MRLVVVIFLLLFCGPASADPVTFFGAVGTWLGSAAITIGTFTVSWGAIVFAAVSTLYGQAQQRRAQKKNDAANARAKDLANASMQDRTVSGVATEFPYRYIYGPARVGVQVVAIFASGARDEFKHIVATVAQREITAMDEIWVAGVPLGTLDGSGGVTGGPFLKIETNSYTETLIASASPPHTMTLARTPDAGSVSVIGSVTDGEFISQQQVGFSVAGNVVTVSAYGSFTINYRTTTQTSMVRVVKHLGTPTDPADAALMAACPTKWFSTSVLRGHAYVYVMLNLNQAEFQGGLPHIEVLARGHALYDPRTELTEYSDNPALVIRDYLLSELGGSINEALLPEAMYITAANACDDVVTTGSWSGKRYTFAGTVTSEESREEVLENMAQSMAGGLVATTWEIYAGVPSAPVMSLVQADIVGDIAVSAGYSEGEIYNTVRGQFIGAENNYVQDDYKPYVQSVYLESDGRELDTDIDRPYTNTFQRCANLARIATEDNRNAFSVNGKFSRKAVSLRVGDRVTFTSSFFGQADKLFMVKDKSYGPKKSVNLALKEDAPEIWDLADAVVVDQTPNTDLPNPFLVLPLTSVTCESGTSTLFVQKDGQIVSRLRVSWPQALTLDILQRGFIEVNYRKPEETDWQKAQTNGAETSLYIVPVNDGEFYIVRARCVNPYVNSSLSDWTYANLHQIVGKTEPPPNIVDLAIAGSVLSWTVPTKEAVPDLAGARFRFHYDSTNFDWGTATPLHDQDSVVVTSPFDLVVRPSGPVVILGKLVDTSGNESTTAGVVITNLGDPVIANVVEVIDFAAEGFPGTIEGGEVASDGLVADPTDSFYGTDAQSFYGPDLLPFYEDETFGHLIYTTDERSISTALAGSILTLELTTEGTDLVVEYRVGGPGSFYGPDVDSFYGPDSEPFYGGPGVWLPWPGQLIATNDVFQFRVTLGAGPTRAKILEFKLTIDAPDIVEYVEDMVVDAAGSVVPYTSNFTHIRTVTPTIQVNGSGAIRLEYDKTVNLAPKVWAYNDLNVAVSGATADVILKGY